MSPLKRKKLSKIRSELDKLDNSLIKIIKKRTNLVKKVLALKEKKNPVISYRGNAVKINDHTATFSGTMNIAGTKKELTTKVKIDYSNGKISLSGKKDFKLTDFNVEPPTAMFGTIKTGDEVAIHYNLQLNYPRGRQTF